MTVRQPVAGRVLIIVQNLSVPMDRRVWMECQALVAAGYQVSVVCPRGPREASFERLDGVLIRRYRPAPRAAGLIGYVLEFVYCWLRTAGLVLRAMVTEGFDVVQACNPPDTYWALALPLKLFGKRFVYDQHDLCPELYSSRFPDGDGPLLRALYGLERATYAVANHVISTNESYKRIARERGALRDDQVTVVRSGPDSRIMRRAEPQPELRHDRRHLAVYLGIMGPQDGVDLLLHSLDVLVHERERTDCHFALLGFGDCRAELKALTGELGLTPWVSFPGRADGPMISAYLSTADVGLSPDPRNPLNDVSTMNKTLEYMAFGLPVVAFDLTETRVSAGGAGLFVPPNDPADYAKAIDFLLDEPEERARMGAIGRRRIEESLGWEHQSRTYVGVYDRLLGRERAR